MRLGDQFGTPAPIVTLPPYLELFIRPLILGLAFLFLQGASGAFRLVVDAIEPNAFQAGHEGGGAFEFVLLSAYELDSVAPVVGANVRFSTDAP